MTMLTVDERHEIIRGECETIAYCVNQMTLMEEGQEGWSNVPYEVYTERWDMLQRRIERSMNGMVCWFTDQQIEYAYLGQLIDPLDMVDAERFADELIDQLV